MVKPDEYEELAMAWLNLQRREKSPKTIARRLSSLRAWARWGNLGEVLKDYIAPTPSRPIPHPIHEGLDGVERMIAQAKNEQQVAIVALGGFVGTRISESISVVVDDFDIPGRRLRILGKGQKERVVPISERALQNIVSAYVQAHDNEGGRLITYSERFSRTVVTNLAKRAGLSRTISSHDLRATFATEAMNKCGNIRVVQELLGHANSATTEIYTGVREDQMRGAVEF